MNINEKLVDIQSRLNAKKGQYNSFGKYRYRSCEDILEAVKPLLKEHSLIVTLNDDIVTFGTRFYVKATVTITDGENRISTTAFAREEESKKGMDGSQVTGASSSYARKYALNGLFAIDDGKDSDSTNKGGSESKKASNAQSGNQSKESKEEPKSQNGEFKCAYCGCLFTDQTTSNGNFYTAENLYYASKKKYGGKAYCTTACAKNAGAMPVNGGNNHA